jgi:hypothetical protein
MNHAQIVISTFCNNVHRSNHLTHAILQAQSHPRSQTNIIIITEPWIGTVRAESQEKGTVHHPAWRCITPPNVANANVTVYYQKDTPFRVCPLSHLNIASESILPISVSAGEDFSIMIMGIYNSPTTHEAVFHLLDSQSPEGPVIICGDLNLHAPEWDSTVNNASALTQRFQDWLMDHNLQVLNDPDRPTYHGHHFQHAKVDDLVIANLDAFEAFNISPIEVLEDQHYASDHYPITFDIFTGTSAPAPEAGPTLSEKYKEKWVNEIRPTLIFLQSQITQDANPESLDRLSQDIINAISTATQKVMPNRTIPSAHEKHWWNEDLDKTITQLRQIAEVIKTSPNPYLRRQYNRTKAVFRARVRHYKRTWVTQRLQGATSQNVWEFTKWYRHGGQQCRPLYSSPSSIPAPSDQERSRIFANQFFPAPPPTDEFQPQDEPTQERLQHPLHPEELKRAIYNVPKDTAPGPSKINYTAIKWMWETTPNLLLYLFSKCMEMGHYPEPFKCSITAVVPKPGKKDYSVPTAFRPIQLIECLGKILDKIIAHRIQYEVAHEDLVPHTQFGGRIHSSTTDAGISFVQDIHNAWSRGMKASALFFDITGFFNAVNHERLTA